MAMAPASFQCFLSGRPVCTATLPRLPRRPSRISCKAAADDKDKLPSGGNDLGVKLGKLAMVALAAGVLALGPVDGAMAAKSGGRVGGQAFRSAPRSSGPRINNSRTNIYINPPVAPPLGGYGYGGYGSPFFGGWGWSPFTFFAPGPSVAVGVGGGFDTLVLFMVLGAVVGAIRGFLNRNNDDYDDY
ncbi:hypothetical protein PR202_ga14516 [Eleusine coracana subsp. coracana]|uniref:Uncharacterized protein n=1 Tax=Eleusine coracana subsp. coracana TaxID=191504 RepID=A0AAV5CHJ0_ELECO|nr:hypothetical protein QOZ80_6BG0502940 [Eleusine coracana subsp. coracana]GJM97580.1 hypothetical protein PR202_ga14516 [Eleusine coracana subsp. coracana]